VDPKVGKKYSSSESADTVTSSMDEPPLLTPSWHFNRLKNPFIEGMAVDFANEQLRGLCKGYKKLPWIRYKRC
jgi:hypothetical protein